MGNCTHENRTIDCVCNDCGCDLIVDAQNDKIRQQERDRILALIVTGTWAGDSLAEDITNLTNLIQGELEPGSHCPDCDDYSCEGCQCLDNPTCESCKT